MSEVPPGCGPHRKAASFWLSPKSNIEQTFAHANTLMVTRMLFRGEAPGQISLSTPSHSGNVGGSVKEFSQNGLQALA